MHFESRQTTNICTVYDNRQRPVPFYNITVLHPYTPTQHIVDKNNWHTTKLSYISPARKHCLIKIKKWIEFIPTQIKQFWLLHRCEFRWCIEQYWRGADILYFAPNSEAIAAWRFTGQLQIALNRYYRKPARFLWHTSAAFISFTFPSISIIRVMSRISPSFFSYCILLKYL